MLSCKAYKRSPTRQRVPKRRISRLVGLTVEELCGRGPRPRRRAAPRGTTLVELAVATAIMATLFAAAMPLFVGIRNSTDSRWRNLEMLQNARVLNDHLGRYLAQAARIVAVSASTDRAGYIECEMEDGVVYRWAVGTRGYVEFGRVGGRGGPGEPPRDGPPSSLLAGPVEYLRFACYDDRDFQRPLERNPKRDPSQVGSQTPAGIRLVTWEAQLKSPGHPAPGRVVTGACCLRAGPLTMDE